MSNILKRKQQTEYILKQYNCKIELNYSTYNNNRMSTYQQSSDVLRLYNARKIILKQLEEQGYNIETLVSY